MHLWNCLSASIRELVHIAFVLSDTRYAIAHDAHLSYKLECSNYLPFRMEFGMHPVICVNGPKKKYEWTASSHFCALNAFVKDGNNKKTYWQSMSSAWLRWPITEISWSIMPHGIPANSCSAFWHSNACSRWLQ